MHLWKVAFCRTVGMALWLLTWQVGVDMTRLMEHIILLQIILKSYTCCILNIR